MAQTVSVIVTAEERVRLAAIVGDRSRPLKHVQRARIVLHSADRLPVLEVARRASVSRPAVWRWQRRYAEEGMDGLLRDKTRPPGRAPVPMTTVAKVLGDCQEFRARLSGLTDQSMARVKRSPKRTANCALAIHHSRGGMIHSFSARFKTRKSNFIAASSLGKWPLALTARRSLELSASIAFVVYKIRRTSTGNA